MRQSALAILVVATLGLGACDSAPLLCTAQFVYGLSVEVVDAQSGQAIADGSTLTIVDGEYSETADPTFDGRTLIGAGERAGTYTLTVTRDGYQTWTLTGVVVTEDECHVIPVSVRAEMIPVP